MTYRDDVEGLDAAILMHPKVWEASGHVENFTDPMVDCKQCKARFRVDTLSEMINEKKKTKALEDLRNGIISDSKLVDKYSSAFQTEDPFSAVLEDQELSVKLLQEINCPQCGNKNTFTTARKFNLMFKTFIGPVEDTGAVVYLRPETAQGIFVNFNNVKDSTRQKLPFGIAQIGKAFRNEINTKNFLYRTREFEQMEMQYFVKQGIDVEKYEYWKENRLNWWIEFGIRKERLQFAPHPQSKLAHYAKDAVDIEFDFPFGWGEIEGIHNRSDFDLSQHAKFSGKKLEYYDDETKERYIPYVIETSAGASRGFMAFLCNAYDEDEAPTADGKVEKRTVLHFHPKLAPIKCAVFPLVNKDGLQEISHGIKDDLQSSFNVFYDESGAVGRRYRRQDECGTPYCVTVDYDTLKDNTVTIRNRDTMKQERIHKDLIKQYILEKLY